MTNHHHRTPASVSMTCRGWFASTRSAMYRCAAGQDYSMAKLVGELKQCLAKPIYVEGEEAKLVLALEWAKAHLRQQRAREALAKAEAELEAANEAVWAWDQ